MSNGGRGPGSARARAFALAVALAAVCTAPLAAQTYAPPRAPWGDPDLQAIWSGDSAFGIPLQRPRELGTKAELTDEEFAAKVARDATTRPRAENAVGSFRNDNAWLTRTFRQTPLVVDPPDGRTPPLVPGAEARRTPQGNLAVLQGLGGERAEDRALEEDAKKGIIRPRRPIQGGLTVGGAAIPESAAPAGR